MNESDTPGPETEPPRDRLSRGGEASRRINESLDFDTVLQGVLASRRDLTRSRYGRWWPYRRPGWSRRPWRPRRSAARGSWRCTPRRRGRSAASQELLDRQRGGTLTLPEGIGERSDRIADIQSKYVRAFQETASGFPARFPGNTDLSRVPVPADDITQFLGVVGLPAR